MWLVFVVLILEVSKELPLKPVDVLYVAEDGLQLQLSEHFWVFTALTDVTLEKKKIHKTSIIYTVMSHENSSDTGQQEVLNGGVEYFSIKCFWIFFMSFLK